MQRSERPPTASAEVEKAEWRMLGWYVIPAIPLVFAYVLMAAYPQYLGAAAGWWRKDLNTDAGEAGVGFILGGYAAVIILAFAVPLITAATRPGLRLRVNGTAALLVGVALPLVIWILYILSWL